ncbi:hypothetical protein AMK59_7098 [Oryctes borbonicus]|uniref:Tc1-like transposase DDE domain-containing protein n=1 Tax=Oryctes borbonicus TaxID=1629725 RepID=A0A0T6AXL4_9SCAR|nr:hypothetical protein AMK59_7098 [Oryctes borbonicus]
MVWGCFAGTAVSDLVRIQGILRKKGYLEILQENAVPSGERLRGRNFTFQEDNDPKHSSRICRNYLASLEEDRLKRMIWPLQSPDLSPIELIWDELDRRIRQKGVTSSQDLWRKLQQAWTEIPATFLKSLILRMPRICTAVIKSKGGHIDEKSV